MRISLNSILAVSITLAGCGSQPESMHVAIGPTELPDQSYERPPAVPFDRSDYVIKLEHMESFYDVPGEAGYLINGIDYGFDFLSFILTETHPNGGPPLHTHEVEEAHIVLSGTMRYVLA